MVNGHLEDSSRREIESYLDSRLSAVKQEIASLQSKTLQRVSNGCRTTQKLEETTSGDIYDENDNWNGLTSDGTTAPQGTYVYRLQVKTRGGEEHEFNGQVNLIR